MAEAAALGLVHAVMGEMFPDAEQLSPLMLSAVAGAGGGAGGGAGSAGALGGRGGGFRLATGSAYLGAAAGRPEAMVKVITRGGCASRADLAAQVAYVAREGDVPIHGAAMFGLDTPLSGDDIVDMLDAWTAKWTGRSKYGETQHMVISYPIGSDPDAVWTAGREFAEAAFGSGDYGDAWDYMTALHTDTAHPHVHVIVNRRGVDSGTLLSTFKGSLLNLDELRRLQVETASANGIEMTATPRLARGITDLAPGTGAYRAALANGVTPDVRTRTAGAVQFAERAMTRHAAAYDGLARVFTKGHHDEVAVLLRECGALLKQGKPIKAEPRIPRPEDFETVGQARTTVMRALSEAETGLRKTKDPAERVRLERELGPVKGKAAAFVPDRADLAAYALPVPDGFDVYRSTALDRAKAQGVDPINGSETARARIEAARAATAAGLDGRAFMARYDLGAPKDAGTAAAWAAQDMVAIMRARGVDPERADKAAIRDASTALDRLHETTARGFEVAARADGVPETTSVVDLAKMRERAEAAARPPVPETPEQLVLLAREAQAAVDNSRDRPATLQERDAQTAFVAAVERQVTKGERAQLMRGDPAGIARLAPQASPAARAGLAVTYIEAKRDIDHEQTRGQYTKAVIAARATLRREKAAESGRDRDDEREL